MWHCQLVIGSILFKGLIGNNTSSKQDKNVIGGITLSIYAFFYVKFCLALINIVICNLFIYKYSYKH